MSIGAFPGQEPEIELSLNCGQSLLTVIGGVRVLITAGVALHGSGGTANPKQHHVPPVDLGSGGVALVDMDALTRQYPIAALPDSAHGEATLTGHGLGDVGELLVRRSDVDWSSVIETASKEE